MREVPRTMEGMVAAAEGGLPPEQRPCLGTQRCCMEKRKEQVQQLGDDEEKPQLRRHCWLQAIYLIKTRENCREMRVIAVD